MPWIHNVKNTDIVTAIDDNGPMGLIRLFNEAVGQQFLVNLGVDADLVARLPELGISSVANVLAAIKTAKYYEMDANDVIITVATDSMDESQMVSGSSKSGQMRSFIEWYADWCSFRSLWRRDVVQLRMSSLL